MALTWILERQLELLAVAYTARLSSDGRYLCIYDFLLPPGYDRPTTEVLIELPSDYPLSPPGVAHRIYLPPSLRFQDRRLDDLHPNVTPGWGSWAWFCYRRIDWDPGRDDLVGFLEMMRADLTNPKTL
jgi:hypothetical protein